VNKNIFASLRIVLIIIVLIVISSFLSDKFLSVRNISNIMRQISVNGILACGMTFVLLTGGFDLSVGATITLTGAIALTLQPYVGVTGAILIAIVVGGIVGLLNGIILSKIQADSGDAFMITLGTQLAIWGVSLLIFNARFIPGSRDPFYMELGTGNLFGVIPIPMLIFAIVAFVSFFILSFTSFGRRIYVTGGNYDAARLSGITVKFYNMIVYVIVGMTAAISAVVLTSRAMGCSSNMGQGYELDAIAAVIVGGTSASGGEGSIPRTIAGVIIIGILSNILNLIGMNSFNQMIVKGLVIIAAVWIDNRSQKV
jgi:ribose transport system permease protein